MLVHGHATAELSQPSDRRVVPTMAVAKRISAELKAELSPDQDLVVSLAKLGSKLRADDVIGSSVPRTIPGLVHHITFLPFTMAIYTEGA